MSKISKHYTHRKWFVLFTSLYLNFIVDGFCFVFGVLAIHIQDDYPDVHPSIVSLVGGIVPTLYNGLAPIGIALVEHFGSRIVSIAGGLLSVVGFVLCWINGTWLGGGFWYDFVTMGIIEGVAFALLYGPSINTIPTFFDHKTKSLAIGITTCGSALGAMFYGFIVEIVIAAWGWRGALIAFAIIALHTCMAALAFPTENELAYVRTHLIKHKHHHVQSHARHQPNMSFWTRYFDVSHFSDCSFRLILTAAALSMAGYYVPTYLVPQQAEKEIYGVSHFVQSKIILIWGCANLVGRLVSGRLADYGRTHENKPYLTSFWIHICGHVVASLALLIFPHTMTFGDSSFVTFVCTYGFFIAPLITMRSVLVTDIYGKHNSSSCFGWLLAVQGLSQLSGFALPAFLDTLSPIYSYLFGAVCFGGSALCVTLTGQTYFEKRQDFFLARVEKKRLRAMSLRSRTISATSRSRLRTASELSKWKNFDVSDSSSRLPTILPQVVVDERSGYESPQLFRSEYFDIEGEEWSDDDDWSLTSTSTSSSSSFSTTSSG